MSMAKITIDDIAKKSECEEKGQFLVIKMMEVKYLHVDFMEWKQSSCLKAKLKE